MISIPRNGQKVWFPIESCVMKKLFSSLQQVVEVVKPVDRPFPDPLEEGISYDIYSTFIESPPALDAETKVCLLYFSLTTPLHFNIILPLSGRERTKYSSVFFLPPLFPKQVETCMLMLIQKWASLTVVQQLSSLPGPPP